MKPSDLKIAIQEGEGTTLEFKENLSGAFARELVAMANTIGGRILLGVRDDGTVAGLRAVDRLLFYGPPGRGKTLTGEVIASELGLLLAVVRDELLSKLMSGELRVKDAGRIAGRYA